MKLLYINTPPTTTAIVAMVGIILFFLFGSITASSKIGYFQAVEGSEASYLLTSSFAGSERFMATTTWWFIGTATAFSNHSNQN
jgi:hypothetical protein